MEHLLFRYKDIDIAMRKLWVRKKKWSIIYIYTNIRTLPRRKIGKKEERDKRYPYSPFNEFGKQQKFIYL